MTYLQRPRFLLCNTAIVFPTLLAFCATVGCESEPPPPSRLTEWLTEAQGTASEAKVRADDNIHKPVPSKHGPHPKAVIPETDFQFGQMRVGTHMHHEFNIINEGEAPLELVAGKPTCKCTQFEVSRSEVPPGESAVLHVEWHGKSETTTFQHGGKVYTNDPNKPAVRFNVGGTVDATVVTQPEGTWNAGEIPGKEPVTFRGTIVSRFLPELSVASVENESEFVSAEYEVMTDDQLADSGFQSGWMFRVTVQPGFPVGILEDTLKVKLEEVEAPVEIPVAARRLGDIRFIPMKGTTLNSDTRTLHLGNFPSANGRTGEFMLMVNRTISPEPLEIIETESSPKSLKFQMEPIGKPNSASARYKVTVEIPPGGLRTERGTDNPATIRCRTNHPTEQEILLKLIYNAF